MAVNNLKNYTSGDGFGMPLNIRRGNPNPLDNSYLHETYAKAAYYAASDPAAYIGQIIAVADKIQKTDSAGTPEVDINGDPIMVDAVAAYIIIDSAGTLLQLVNTESTGDAALDLAKLTTRVGALEGLAGNTPLKTTATNLTDAINELYDNGGSGGGGIPSQDFKDLQDLVGTGTLQAPYADLISAVNDLLNGSSSGGGGTTPGGKVTLTLEPTPNAGCLATYTLEQDGAVVGQIDIPKDGDISSLQTDLTGIKQDIADLQTDMTGVQIDIGTLQTDVTGLQGDMTNVKTDIGTLQTDVGNIKTDISGIQTDIGNLQTDVGTLQTDVANIQTDIGTMQGDISTAQSDITNMKNLIGTGTLPGGATDIIKAINDINSKGATPPEDE